MPWNLVDMEMDDEQQMDAVYPLPLPEKPSYPPGLRICLNAPELAKLGLDADCSVGDMIDMRAFAVVTSVSKDENGARVELQIQKIALSDEMNETT